MEKELKSTSEPQSAMMKLNARFVEEFRSAVEWGKQKGLLSIRKIDWEQIEANSRKLELKSSSLKPRVQAR